MDERARVLEYLTKLQALCKEYDTSIGACGCCDGAGGSFAGGYVSNIHASGGNASAYYNDERVEVE